MVIIVVGFFMYIFPRLVWSVDAHACWCGGPFFAGGDGLFYPNRFCRLGCRVSMSCFVSIGVFCALYICLILEVWIIIINYMRNYSLLGKGEVVIYCYCSFMLGFVMCRLLSVQVVTVPMPIHYMCEYISRSAIFPVWLFFVEALPWSGYVFG